MEAFRIPFKRKTYEDASKGKKGGKKGKKGTGAKESTKLKGEPGAKPLLIRTVASWPYQCGHCKQLSDHPNKCAKCGVSFAMLPSPHFDPEVAALLATPASKTGSMKLLSDILDSAKELPRRSTELEWFDHVIGGGIVSGKVYLIAGGPGTGKSTALFQAIVGYAGEGHRCLYVSGEEDETQIANRAIRIRGIRDKMEYIDLFSTKDTGEAAGAIRASKPALVIIDSIQEIGDEELETNFGGAKQVDNLMNLCVDEAKKVGAAVIFVCQVTKSGDPAGPKRAEHKTDCNLQIEAIDRGSSATTWTSRRTRAATRTRTTRPARRRRSARRWIRTKRSTASFGA